MGVKQSIRLIQEYEDFSFKNKLIQYIKEVKVQNRQLMKKQKKWLNWEMNEWHVLDAGIRSGLVEKIKEIYENEAMSEVINEIEKEEREDLREYREEENITNCEERMEQVREEVREARLIGRKCVK